MAKCDYDNEIDNVNNTVDNAMKMKLEKRLRASQCQGPTSVQLPPRTWIMIFYPISAGLGQVGFGVNLYFWGSFSKADCDRVNGRLLFKRLIDSRYISFAYYYFFFR